MTLITHGHASLQFSDSAKQKEHDVAAVFGRGYNILTGTESGEEPLSSLIRKAAREHDYRIRRWRGNWVAVQKSMIVKGTLTGGDIFVAKTSEVHGPGHDSGFPWLKFFNKDLGYIAVAAIHYPTKGRTPKDPNYDIINKYSNKVGGWARRHGKGKALAFVQGDVNIPDDKFDVFRGQPLTTCWDELGKHPNTGHGNIDMIASYDHDGRVKCVKARAFTDKQFFLHSDHFLIEATYDVKPLRKGK